MILIQISTICAESAVKTAVNSQTNTDINSSKNMMIILIIMLGINIMIMIVKYFFDRSLKKQDVGLKKKMLITNISIEKETDLFLQLEQLRNFQKNERNKLLDYITSIEAYIALNKLYISKKIYEEIDLQLDYYKKLVFDYSIKDIKKEKRFIDTFCKLFYGK